MRVIPNERMYLHNYILRADNHLKRVIKYTKGKVVDPNEKGADVLKYSYIQIKFQRRRRMITKKKSAPPRYHDHKHLASKIKNKKISNNQSTIPTVN